MNQGLLANIIYLHTSPFVRMQINVIAHAFSHTFSMGFDTESEKKVEEFFNVLEENFLFQEELQKLDCNWDSW